MSLAQDGPDTYEVDIARQGSDPLTLTVAIIFLCWL